MSALLWHSSCCSARCCSAIRINSSWAGNFACSSRWTSFKITDSRLGVSALTVRITAVEEDEEGTLSITAEDFFGGYSTAVVYPKQSGAGYVPNWNSPPGDVNPPIILEPPAALLTGGLEIWVALSGGANWGGAQVWISSDGNSYALAGTVNSLR